MRQARCRRPRTAILSPPLLLRPYQREARRPAVRDGVDGKLILNMEMTRSGDSCREKSVSLIVVTVLSVALVRLALLCVYPKRANWDE